MSEKVERALEIVRSFTEAEFHSFMEMLYISESSHSNISFNDLIGKNRFKNGIVCPHLTQEDLGQEKSQSSDWLKCHGGGVQLGSELFA